MTCIDPDVLLAYLAGNLAVGSTTQAREHIATCDVCHAIASDLVLTAASNVPAGRAPRAHEASYELTPGAGVGGRYVLDAMLGEGAMGVVWRATRRADGEAVAIKFLKGFDSASRRRFEREVTIASSLVHRGLVRVVEVLPDIEADCPALVLELLEGTSLAARLVDGPLEVTAACRVAMETAEALAHVHRANVVHRDLKPANLFLVRPASPGALSTVKVLDLGLGTVTKDGEALAASARITRTGQSVGTPAYMSPEQLSGSRVGPAADVWALGVTTYEAVTGTRPFTGRTSAALLQAIVRTREAAFAPLRGLVPPSLQALLTAMLAAAPNERPTMDVAAERFSTLAS